MTDVMHALVSEAKKNRFSTIPKLTDEDVVSVWDNVSQYVEKQMSMQKGVQIPGLGTFTFTQKKLDIGNNKFILIQRPVFILSEKFAMTHGLNYTKHHTTGQIPIMQLNFSALSTEGPFDRDTVEGCVKEVLQALSRAVGARRNVEFTFCGIGRLSVRDGKVKMKFYKDFIQMMDGSGRLNDALRNRPDTADSVMSRASYCRPYTTNTLVLPRIGATKDGFAPDEHEKKEAGTMPAIKEADEDVEENEGKKTSATQTEEEEEEGKVEGEKATEEEDAEKPSSGSNRHPSRQLVPTAKATGISLIDDLIQPQLSQSIPKGIRDSSLTPSPPNSKPHSPREPLGPPRVYSNSRLVKSADDAIHRVSTPDGVRFRTPSPASTACGHALAGQELCYLCHQRDLHNIPISFEIERRRKEMEQDRLLQQFQHMKDTEAIIREQAQNFGDRHEGQKIAAFNLGVAEAIKAKKRERSVDFHRSYIFQNRPLTPPRFIKQEELAQELSMQVDTKAAHQIKRKHDKEFLERLEQVQLAEDLAFQREQYLKEKREQCDAYQRALSAQVRFKPLPLPAAVSDSKEPIFGKNDCTNEKLADQRRRAHEIYQEQLDTVANKKKDQILRHLRSQREEVDMLERTRRDLIADRATHHERNFTMRKSLESDWKKAFEAKKYRDFDERMRGTSAGMLLHEQCDKYKRCGQCKRRLENCGESNIWSESRYIPGSRLIM
ncbi:coiled-coil domain-containing protein 81-like [Saccoglossus kowalevskii]|uniref:Coiled-coil domain-containing protein 81-like n=1 Tax=Saccoglossus kowalevskii TaxID=10224 RepID=A0ABM0GLC0_SACKO|nr:PREDICTED: coiled-coil domain-containing protein 81-like [Saccoglossus kowalevskii]